jgi:GNAT superfamily N-acetyltransferase
MHPEVTLSLAEEILPLRVRHRQEMNCQIVHDSIHTRNGWTLTYAIRADNQAVGFGSIAVGGPWTDKPTLFEFYLLPDFRWRAFEFFEKFLEASHPKFLEIQSNDSLATSLTLTYAKDMATESVVFQDTKITSLPPNSATLRAVTPLDEIRSCIEERQGGGEWVLQFHGQEVGKGGILFHYNRPYGDIYMEVNEPFRRRGFGSFLVQELKQNCYSLGAIPCARCSPTNLASRRTLQRAGFVPFAHILIGSIAR